MRYITRGPRARLVHSAHREALSQRPNARTGAPRPVSPKRRGPQPQTYYINIYTQSIEYKGRAEPLRTTAARLP